MSVSFRSRMVREKEYTEQTYDTHHFWATVRQGRIGLIRFHPASCGAFTLHISEIDELIEVLTEIKKNAQEEEE